MKFLAFILLLLIALMQYPLWLGKASWGKVWQVDQDVIAARENNLILQNRNNILEAEVNDLKQGLEAIEERARSDLGMTKQDEILFQIVKSTQSKASQPHVTQSAKTK